MKNINEHCTNYHLNMKINKEYYTKRVWKKYIYNFCKRYE